MICMSIYNLVFKGLRLKSEITIENRRPEIDEVEEARAEH